MFIYAPFNSDQWRTLKIRVLKYISRECAERGIIRY